MQSVALTDSVQQDDEYVLVQSPFDFGATGTLYDEEENGIDDDDNDDDGGSYDYCDDAFSPPLVTESFTVDRPFLPETIQEDFFGPLQNKHDSDNVKILFEGMRISSSVILSDSTEQRSVSTDLRNQPPVTIENLPHGPDWFSSSPPPSLMKPPLHTEIWPFASSAAETSTSLTRREPPAATLYQKAQEQLHSTPHGQHSQDEDLYLIEQAHGIANPLENHIIASSDKILDAQQESAFATTAAAAATATITTTLLALPLPLSVAVALSVHNNNTETQEPSSSVEAEPDDSDVAEREESSSCNNETELDSDSDTITERDSSIVAVATTRNSLSRTGDELSGDDDKPESSCATTAVTTTSAAASRLPNKKRRKQMKQAKKAVLAAVTQQIQHFETQPNNLSLDRQQLWVRNNNDTADATSSTATLFIANNSIITATTALSSSSSSSITSSASASSPFGKKLLLAKTKKKTSKKQVANIAVTCATQAFDHYQQEVVQKNSSKKPLR